ncbi:RNA-binding protein [Virgibacillus phasianinus]|uniref:RNA-binding protein n=1 Tax=Virgibacillus phasianinus TaxID=2017483 RepID=A0A220U066_9BACI|nr:ASCH domain-containing protein [Virgibacillus phasianinus]ASK61469.1 RNA-binding protein [Virgibacillus phasianinus]
MAKTSVENMWENYLQTLPESERKDKNYTSWAFGSDVEMAKELADLVKSGEKTATCSLHMWYEMEQEPLPFKGELNIITDWNGEAEAVTETTNVQILPFNEVSAEFAAKEGEGDKSYDYWRRVHVEFFSNELKPLNKLFDENMLVVCEEFKLVIKIN